MNEANVSKVSARYGTKSRLGSADPRFASRVDERIPSAVRPLRSRQNCPYVVQKAGDYVAVERASRLVDRRSPRRAFTRFGLTDPSLHAAAAFACLLLLAGNDNAGEVGGVAASEELHLLAREAAPVYLPSRRMAGNCSRKSTFYVVVPI